MGKAKRRGRLKKRIKRRQMSVCIHEAAHCYFAYHKLGADSFEYVSVDKNEVIRRESESPEAVVSPISSDESFEGVTLFHLPPGVKGSKEMDIVLFAGAAAVIVMTNVRKKEAYRGGESDFRMSRVKPEFYRDFCDGIASILSTHKEQIAAIKAIADKLYEKRTLSAEEVAEIIEQQ